MSIADDYLEPGELRPCPFCGADAEVLHFEAPDCSADDDNYGGSCVQCSRCNASSAVVFGFKETLYSSWNERAIPDLSTLTRERDQAREALAPFAAIAEHDIANSESDDDLFRPLTNNRAPHLRVGHLRRARSVLHPEKEDNS